MTDPVAKISIGQQIEEITRVIYETKGAASRGATGKARPAEMAFRIDRQEAIFRTLAFCRDEREVIRALRAMSPEDRAAIVSHGHLVAQMARELARREEVAKAGGPVR